MPSTRGTGARLRRAARTITLVGALLALAGCGAYSKQDFVTHADAVCSETLNRLRALPPLSPGPDAQAEYLHRAVPLVQREDRRLDALRRPPGSAAQRALLSRYLSAVNALVGTLAAMDRAASTRNLSGLQAGEAALRRTTVPRLADAYGLTGCRTPGPTLG